jgi:hypothetical protein
MIKNNKEVHQSSYRFLLDPPSESLLLDGLMSSSDSLSYGAYDKKDVCIIPVHVWIEEACSSRGKPWHALIILSHDHYCTSCFNQRILAYDYLILYVSLFWFLTKHKSKFQGIDELIKWFGYIGFMILLNMLCLLC